MGFLADRYGIVAGFYAIGAFALGCARSSAQCAVGVQAALNMPGSGNGVPAAG